MADIPRTNIPGFEYDPYKNDTLIGQLDPFIGTVQQTSRMRAFCKITVNGLDVTDKMNPYLISVHVTRGKPASAAEIELDDRDSILPLPPLGVPVSVSLGWESEILVTVFDGIIVDIESGFGRKQGGRRMWVHCKGWNELTSMLKQPIQDQKGEGAPPGKPEGQLHGLPDWLNQLTGHAGVTASISGALGKIKSDMWHTANASVMHTIESLSKDHGFTYMFDGGNKVQIEIPGEGGLSCYAIWRDNLIGWRVRPFVAKAAFTSSQQQFYDVKAAGWKSVLQKFGLSLPGMEDGGGVGTQSQSPAATETNANEDNEGAQTEAGEGSAIGNGRIMINGEPRARWNSFVLLAGARPGVDGLYRIVVVEHEYSRKGFITTLEVMPKIGHAAGAHSPYDAWLPKAQPNPG